MTTPFEQGKADAAGIVLDEYLREKAKSSPTPGLIAWLKGREEKDARPELGRMTSYDRRLQGYKLVNQRRREALENGGPEHLDVADLRERLAKRNGQCPT